MDSHGDILARIDEIEGELRGLSGEVHELRALLAKAAAPTAEAVMPAPASAAAAPALPLSGEKRRETAVVAARILLSEGRAADALDELERAIVVAVDCGDEDGLRQLGAELQGIARYRPAVRDRALELADDARTALADVTAAGADAHGRPAPTPVVTPPVTERPGTVPPTPTPTPTPTPAPAPALHAPVAHVAAAPRPAPPDAPPSPPRRGIGELARDLELIGPRGFAIVGGAVTALGIILLFVLAANNGWITPSMRVLMGVGVSALAIGAGFWARARYGQVQVSLGATGAGIAGSYACLAAATARYDLVPDWLALPLAAAIAAIAVLISVMWSSQIVAAIGLLGAAFAPGLQAIDTGMTWAAAAFGVIVLVATIILAIPRRWHVLLIGITAVVTAEVAWLAYASDASPGRGTVAVVVALVLVVLVAGVLVQLASKSVDLSPLASSFSLGALGVALLLAPLLSESGRSRGIALAAAAVVWAVAWAMLRVRQPSLGLVLGVSALTLTAVASADLLSGTGLAVTWAAESVLLSTVAWRLRDTRLQVMALAYGALATVYVLGVVAPLDLLFGDPVAGTAAISVVALAVALLAAAFLAPAEPVPRTETGILAWLSTVRSGLASNRTRLRDALALGGAALGTYAAMIALVSVSFERGHLAATIVATVVGSAATVMAARRDSEGLVAAALVWLAVVYLEAAIFDAPEFAVTGLDRSYGGWALVAAAAGALAGCFGFQVVYPKPVRPILPGIAGAIALLSWFGGLALVSPSTSDVLSSTWIGWRMLVPVAVFVALSASVFRVPRHRDLATIMWALGLAALILCEWLILGGGSRAAFSAALTGGAVALAAAPLREQRLWWGGALVVSVTSVAVLVLLTPATHFLAASSHPGAGLWVAVGCLAAGLALRFSGSPYRRWIDPILAVGALYVISLGILEIAERSFGGSVESDFGRGHVVVSALWALIGLGLLVAGLLRNERWLRFGGLALFGLSLAKIFLYDLTTLSSVARAVSFIAVGALVLAGGFFLQRLSSRIGARPPVNP